MSLPHSTMRMNGRILIKWSILSFSPSLEIYVLERLIPTENDHSPMDRIVRSIGGSCSIVCLYWFSKKLSIKKPNWSGTNLLARLWQKRLVVYWMKWCWTKFIISHHSKCRENMEYEGGREWKHTSKIYCETLTKKQSTTWWKWWGGLSWSIIYNSIHIVICNVLVSGWNSSFYLSIYLFFFSGLVDPKKKFKHTRPLRTRRLPLG